MTDPTPIDAAVHAMVVHLGAEDDLADRDLAEAVDLFMAQLGEVAATATSTQDFIAAAARFAAGQAGVLAAGWAAYLGGIRGLDLAYRAATAAVVAEAEGYLQE